MKNSFERSFVDYHEFDEFQKVNENENTCLATSQLKSSPSQTYLFKIFEFECVSPKNQKIVLDTFYQIHRMRLQYLLGYSKISLSFQSKLTPTFAMRLNVPSKTLEQVLATQDILTSKKILNCIFAVAEAMLYLHSHLICHGNICPSNIIIDRADQYYLCDYGLYPIKKLYYQPIYTFNEIYKDPAMENDEPTFDNDVYSFGVLMCNLILVFLQQKNEMKIKSLKDFLKNNDQNKFSIIPKAFAELIKQCLNSFTIERPSFKKIVDFFRTSDDDLFGCNVQNSYNEFYQTNYLIELASNEDTFAMNKIGKMYEKGKYFKKDLEKAAEYYKRAADNNNSEAQNNYGILLQKKADENPENLEKGAHYLQLSAEQGNIHGMARYGFALLNGNGVEKNVQKAKEYLKKSADLGYSFAQFHYGVTLLDHNPSLDVFNKGLRYIKKAINQRNVEAYYTYGKLLLEGHFIEKNERSAMEYFKMGAEMGHLESMLEYARCNKEGIGTEKNDEIASKYYHLASCSSDGNCSVNTKETIPQPKEDTTTKKKQPKQVKAKKKSADLSKAKSNNSSEQSSAMSSAVSSAITSTNNSQEISKHSDESQTYIYAPFLTRDKDGNFEFPIQISQKNKLISLGEVVYDRPLYHTDKYIYPVGYQLEKEYFSIEDPRKQSIYRASILDGNESPIFRVECLETHMIFEGSKPSSPWNDIKNKIMESKSNLGLPNNDTSISGPKFFGFSFPVVIYLIDKLPNADKCVNHVFKKYLVHGIDDESEDDEDDENANSKVEKEKVKEKTPVRTRKPRKPKTVQFNKEQVLQANLIDNNQQNLSNAKNEQSTSTIQININSPLPQNTAQISNESSANTIQINITNPTTPEAQMQAEQSKPIYKQAQNNQSNTAYMKTQSEQINPMFAQAKSEQQSSIFSQTKKEQQPPIFAQTKKEQQPPIFAQTKKEQQPPIFAQTKKEQQTSAFVPRSNSNQNLNSSISADDILKQGDDFYIKKDHKSAYKCYEEAAKRGKAEGYLKLVSVSPSFEEKIRNCDLAIQHQVPNAINHLRNLYMSRKPNMKEKEQFLTFAKLFEKYGDFICAASAYDYTDDQVNFQNCYDKAKTFINNITEPDQQYLLGEVLSKHDDKVLALIVLNNTKVPKYEPTIKLIDEIQAQLSCPQPSQPQVVRPPEQVQQQVQNPPSFLQNPQILQPPPPPPPPTPPPPSKPQVQPSTQFSSNESLLFQEGIDYFEGINGKPHDPIKALKLFYKVNNIFPKANYYIGNFYKDEKDIQSAMKSYQSAAINGVAEAQYEYGIYKYENGKTNEEKEEGKSYLEKSAGQGYQPAVNAYSQIKQKVQSGSKSTSKEMNEWNKTERDKLQKFINIYGWSHWDNSPRLSNINRPVQQIKLACRAFLRHLLTISNDMSQFPTAQLLIDDSMSNEFDPDFTNERDAEELDILFMRQPSMCDSYFVKSMEKNGNAWIKRVELLYYLTESVEKAGRDVTKIIIPKSISQAPFPAPSWNTSDDQFLIYGTWKHGFARYDDMIHDDEIQFTCKEVNFPTSSVLTFRIKRLSNLLKKLFKETNDNTPLVDFKADGTPKLPQEVDTDQYIISLGHIVTDRPGFHNEDFIFPVGYIFTRLFTSYKDPTKQERYFCLIIDTGGPEPLFRVYMESEPQQKFEGLNPSQPWANIVKRIRLNGGIGVLSVSGTEYFGLGYSLTSYLIQEMKDAEKCKRYKKKIFSKLDTQIINERLNSNVSRSPSAPGQQQFQTDTNQFSSSSSLPIIQTMNNDSNQTNFIQQNILNQPTAFQFSNQQFNQSNSNQQLNFPQRNSPGGFRFSFPNSSNSNQQLNFPQRFSSGGFHFSNLHNNNPKL